ncbi:MAG: penicillin-binding protein [Actinomycetota bacterium]|nr:penicillin-binding protein [Actinomycetota bacterium]
MSITSRRKLLSVCALVALCMASCSRLTDQLAHLPHLTTAELHRAQAQSSKIFDAHGDLIRTLHGEQNRTDVPLSKVPLHVQRALIAIEDQRFYQHNGVDVHAILRALATNVSSGTVQQGGSTLTQQYVKNAIIAPGQEAARTLTRKLDEAALARQLEQRWSKKKILDRYLNTVYFGEGAYGIQAAANTYFGKPVPKLTLGEGALLAGMVQSPEYFDPFKYPKAARARRDVVLGKMAQLGWITSAKAEKAATEHLHLQRIKGKNRYPAAYFIDYVQRLITYDPRFAVLGKTVAERTKKLFQGGLRIHTTVDLKDEKAAKEAIKSQLPYRTDPHAALVSINPQNGYVKAMVGGRNWFAPPKADPFSKLNLAILAEPNLGNVRDATTSVNRAPGTGRQAGSSFKPFALATAIAQGIPLSKTYRAAPCMTFPHADNGGPWRVCNYEGEAFGRMPLLEATVNSVNVVYAQLIIELGAQNVVDTAKRMGIRTPLVPVDSAVLGSNPVNALDMASAYGTFATNGIHHPPVAITSIENANGKVLYRDHSHPTTALQPAVSYLTTTALEQVILRGTGTAAGIGRPAAGKTGTAEEYRDAWFVGYTPNLVTSVWMGYPQGEIEMKPSCLGAIGPCRVTRSITSGGVVGGSFPALIWHSFMQQALANVPPQPFQQPAIQVVTLTIDTRNGCLAGPFTPTADQAQATFQPGGQPTRSCPESGDTGSMPDVTGLPIAEATTTLTNDGFEVTQHKQASTTHPAGRVLSQSPSAGTQVSPGAKVSLTVSVKPGTAGGGPVAHASVPNVIGMTRAAALRSLSANFRPKVVTEKEPGHWKQHRGQVWKQSPAGGKQAEVDSTVTVWVNPG